MTDWAVGTAFGARGLTVDAVKWLPAGVTFNSTTGALADRATVADDYRYVVLVHNGAGQQQGMVIAANVEALPKMSAVGQAVSTMPIYSGLLEIGK